VIGEELGFAGVIAVIALFSCWCCGIPSAASPWRWRRRTYERSAGVWFGVQSFINMA